MATAAATRQPGRPELVRRQDGQAAVHDEHRQRGRVLGWSVDDIQVYTCDPPVHVVAGKADDHREGRVGKKLTAKVPGVWKPRG